MELSTLDTKSIDHHNKGKSRVQASNTNRSAGAGAESNKTSDHNTTRTAYNAGLTDLKLEKASVVVSGLGQAAAVTLSFTAKNPDATPTATRKTSSGIFRMEPAPEKPTPTPRCGPFYNRKKEKQMVTSKTFVQPIGAVFQTIRRSVHQHIDKRHSP